MAFGAQKSQWSWGVTAFTRAVRILERRGAASTGAASMRVKALKGMGMHWWMGRTLASLLQLQIGTAITCGKSDTAQGIPRRSLSPVLILPNQA